jgi:hypothetical protein
MLGFVLWLAFFVLSFYFALEIALYEFAYVANFRNCH